MSELLIITVYNNDELYENMKETVFETKNNLSVEFIGLDNKQNKYSCAAKAYNNAIEEILNREDIDKETNLIFCHQDLLFKGNTIEKLNELCTKENNVLFGLAGVTDCKKYYDLPKKEIRFLTAINDLSYMKKDEILDVFTLDELLVAGNVSIFSNIRFDEAVCDDWHLYVADICLQCHLKGYGVKVFGGEATHLSDGHTNKAYKRSEKRLARKYNGVFPIINYTCGSAYTNPILFHMYRIYGKIKYEILGK